MNRSVRVWLFEGPTLRSGWLRLRAQPGVFEIILDLFKHETLPRLIGAECASQFSHLIAHVAEECEWKLCREAQAAGWPLVILGGWRPNSATISDDY